MPDVAARAREARMTNNCPDRQQIKAERDRLPYGKRHRHTASAPAPRRRTGRMADSASRRTASLRRRFAARARTAAADRTARPDCRRAHRCRRHRRWRSRCRAAGPAGRRAPCAVDDQKEKAGRGRDQDRGRDQPDALARKPGAAAQNLACPVHAGSSISDGVVRAH